ncbi:MAG: hypothetical protein U9N63_04705 [Pseudomonadota bacterium]|nr:hypothetical protein [Pseudomonadota bacterium]
MENKRQIGDSRLKWGFKRILVIELGVLFIIGIFVLQVQAAVFNPDCSSAGLVAAITSANGNGETNVINLPADCTITLDAINNTADGNNGLPDIATDITVNGNGGTIERNSASGSSFRIFHIASIGKLTLNNITIQNGSEPGAEGGGICNRGVLNLNDSTIANNNNNDFGGGGIYTDGVAVNIANSTILNNSTDFGGGGIRQVSGTLTITDSTIYSNHSAYGGGGININYGDVVLDLVRCNVMHNTSQTSGGGISGNEAFGGSITIINSFITDNQAGFYGYGGGGGISLNFSEAEFVSLENTTISHNYSVSSGGGISHSNTFAPLTISNCTISNNEANNSGGGISSVTTGSAQLSISDSTFSENYAGSAGGAIHTNSLFSITASIFSGNISGYENEGQGGGGAINFPSVYVAGDVINCTFADNTAGLDGGGVHSYGTVNFTNCTFSGNLTPNGSGEALCVAGGTITLHNIIVTSSLRGDIGDGNCDNADPTLTICFADEIGY